MFTQAETPPHRGAPLRPLAAADRPRPAPDGRARRADLPAALPRSLGAQRRPRAACGAWRARHAHGGAAHGRGQDGRRGERALRRLDARRAPIPTPTAACASCPRAPRRSIATPIEMPARRARGRAPATTRAAPRWNFPRALAGRDLAARATSWTTQLAASLRGPRARGAEPRVLAAQLPRREPARRARAETRSPS